MDATSLPASQTEQGTVFMTLQQSPRNLSNPLKQVDRAASGEITPPIYGGPQRDAISSVVDNITSDLCGKIGELRKMLDTIEQQILQSAAKSKVSLHGHIASMVRLNDEILHMKDVVTELAEDTRDA